MIVNQDKSQANIIGEVQSNKVGIDINNINFITNLLTSNLYSKPIQSFLRETVANAWDSQVEAGNINTPILIKIDNIDDEDLDIAIRDYGTGLSPERFDEIYRNIGSSTKRLSNNYIGALGIGRFSCLAVNDIVSVKSYYNKKLYSYLMYKDGESLNIDLLNVSDTEFDNGVEVKVSIKDSYYKRDSIIEGLAALAYFEQIYISSNVDYLSNFVDRFNKRTIHEFDNFKVCSLKEVAGLHFLMGNVLYKNNDYNLVEFDNNPAIAIKCSIGEVDVTPNRESLRFSDKTKSILEYKLNAVNTEIYEKAKELLNKDFNTIEDWNLTINNENLKVLLWYFKDEDYKIYAAITPDQMKDNNLIAECTIRGKIIPKDLIRHYNFIHRMQTPYNFISYYYQNLQFCKGGQISLYKLEEYIKENKVYTIKESFKPTTKAYLREQYGHCRKLFIREESFNSTYKELLRSYIKWLKIQDLVFSKQIFLLIVEEIYETFKNLKSINNSDVPKEWLIAKKEEKAQNKRRSFVIHTVYYGRQGVTTSTENTITDIIKRKTTVIYDERNSEYLRNIFKLFNDLGIGSHYTFIEVAKTNIDILNNFKNFININDFTTKYQRVLSKVFTGTYIIKNCIKPYIDYPLYNNDGYKILLQEYKKYCFENLKYIVSSNNKDFEELYEYYKSKKWIDFTIINQFNNPDIEKMNNFCKNVNLASYHSKEVSKIAVNYFVYKYNIKINSLNKRNAYNFLKTI